ncbi:MAG: methyltransferase domain-containing protein [Sphingomonas sp.]
MPNPSLPFSLPTPTPGGLLNRLKLYRARYGAVHAVTRFAGTKLPFLWQMFGPTVSKAYRRKWEASAQGPRLLNLGGGGNTIEGALTVDIDPRADSYVNVMKTLPFESGSIDLILLEELIEHVDKDRGSALLRECFRIMKPGGTMRVATPDLDWLSAGILDGSVSCDLLNSTFYEHGHVYIYSRAEMLRALGTAGFSDCVHYGYKDPDSVLGFLDSHADRFDHDPRLSQYVEARRPA